MIIKYFYSLAETYIFIISKFYFTLIFLIKLSCLILILIQTDWWFLGNFFK